MNKGKNPRLPSLMNIEIMPSDAEVKNIISAFKKDSKIEVV